MSIDIEGNLKEIKEKINKAAKNYNRDGINLVAVSKTVDSVNIKQAIKLGCKIFGENKISEAKEKWPKLKSQFPEIKLHLIGHLQSNKAKEAVSLFDVIETLDSEKLAKILAEEMKKQNKYPEIFIQINIGEEPQKHGISPREADEFIKTAINKYKLPITGIMGIPPQNEDPTLYFALLNTIARNNNLKNISMGMSADYELAIALGATHIRIGSAIFGKRLI
jgi:pyridoxal phosphate enzyme (YggS family)